MVQGVTRLCKTSVLIKPPPNQGDTDAKFICKKTFFLEKIIGFQQN
jgi:hypothetical protein